MASVVYEPRAQHIAAIGPLSGQSWDFDDQKIGNQIDNTGLNRTGLGNNNVDRYLFADAELHVTESAYGAGFTAGDWIEMYIISEELDMNETFEDGDDSIEPPAANYIGSFILNANATQVHTLRQIPIPPTSFKMLLINKSDLISNYELKMKAYRYKTLE